MSLTSAVNMMLRMMIPAMLAAMARTPSERCRSTTEERCLREGLAGERLGVPSPCVAMSWPRAGAKLMFTAASLPSRFIGGRRGFWVGVGVEARGEGVPTVALSDIGGPRR